MPSGYLHALIAQRACALSGVTPVDHAAFHLGALGPDVFFFRGMFPLRLSSRPDKLGNRLHTLNTGKFLCTLVEKALKGDSAQKAFALGYLTHYALDSTVHPYVYSRSYKPDGAYSSSLHMKLERRWDGYFYRRETGTKGQPHVFAAVADSRKYWSQLSSLMSQTISEVFPQDAITPEEIISLFEGACFVNRLLYSPFGGKYALCWVFEHLIGKPRLLTSQLVPAFFTGSMNLNEDRLPWCSPFAKEEERTQSVPDLLDASTRKASELMRFASRRFDGECSAEDFARAVGNLRYDSGMPCEE